MSATLLERDVTVSELVMDAGLPGFPDAHRFLLRRLGGAASPFSVLRCLDVEGLDFVVAAPGSFFPDYEPRLDSAAVDRLGITDADDVMVLVIVTPGTSPGDATANLLGPVVVNRHTLQAAQVVQASADADVRVPLPSR